MLCCSRARRAVKVLSASLSESFPLTGSNKNALVHRATLTFHLHRSSPMEAFGVACAFGVLDDFPDVCFVRSVSADLTASSTVLASLLRHGKPASTEALRVLSLNGEVNPSEKRVKALMKKERDAIFQCAVSTPVESLEEVDDDDAAAAGVEEDEEALDSGVSEEDDEASGTSKPGRRGRKPVHAMSEEAGKTSPAAAPQDDDADSDEVSSVEAAPKKRGRKPLKGGPRRVLRRAENKGKRATMTRYDAEAEEGGTAAEAEETASEAAVNEAVKAALESTSPPAQIKVRRHRRTKAEMAAARMQLAAAKAKADRQAKTDEADGDDGDEADDNVWYRRGKKKRMEDVDEEGPTGADGDEVEQAKPLKTKRGRKEKKANRPDESAKKDAAEAAAEKSMDEEEEEMVL